jgi:GNAT superfamily N-acetyltransferase
MTESHIRLRDVTAKDADAVAALLAELGHPTRASDIPARLLTLSREGGAAIVAVDDDDEALGLITLARYNSLHSAGPKAYITAMVTASTARRRGVGKLLVARAFEWARANGCARLTVTSAERRSDAHAFYPACGIPYDGRRFAVALDITPRSSPAP